MRKLIAPLAVIALLTFVGCKDANHDDSMHNDGTMKTTEPKKMSTDACSHCSGNQVATANGTCPICGGKADNTAK